jgi:hypothetical protein
MAVCYEPDRGTARVYFGTDTRAAATLLGALVAALLRGRLRRWPGPSRPGADVLAVLALAVVTAASFALDGSEPFVYRGGLLGLAAASSLVVGGVVLAPRGLASRLLGLAPLRWLGLVSYGVYLWHWPIYLAATPERVGFGGVALTVLRIALTLLVASVSYLVLELPIRRRRWLAKRPLPAALAAGAAVLVAVWLATPVTPERDAPPAQTADVDVDLLLLGDSVAFQLQEAFVEEAGRRGLAARALAAEGCVSLRSGAIRFLSGQVFDLAPCLRFREGWIAAVERLRPDAVLLLEGWSGEGDKRLDGRWTHPCRADFDAAYAADLSELVTRFGASGTRTWLGVLPPPSVADLSPRYANNWGDTGDAELAELFRERVACLNRVRREVAADTGAGLVDLEALVCPGGECRREIGGVTLRPDGVHFQREGARWAARHLLDQLRKDTAGP